MDFRLIEIVESVYTMGADAIIQRFAVDPGMIQRHKIAEIIYQWLSNRNTGYRRAEIVQHVMTASPVKLTEYSSMIWAALSFTLNYFDPEDIENNAKLYDDAVQKLNEAVSDKPEKEAGKKKPLRVVKPSPGTATG